MNTEGRFKAFTAQLKNKIKENDSKYKTIANIKLKDGQACGNSLISLSLSL